MDFLEARPSRQLFYLTACISLLVHLIVLLLPASAPHATKPQQRLSVRLAPKTVATVKPAPAPAELIQDPTPNPAAPKVRKAVPTPNRATKPNKPALTSPEPAPVALEEPKYTQAQRDNINSFLDSLGPTPRQRAQPKATINERAMAAARDIGRDYARSGDDGLITVERVPNSPPVDRFSLESYLETLLGRLNRNARIMRRPEDGGRRTASMQLRINPDGTIKNLEVLSEGDQKSSIEYIKRLLQLSAPYAPFPAALVSSAKSLAITICIKPGQDGDAGFTRFERGEGRSC